MVFFSIVFPVFTIIVIGYICGKTMDIEVKTPSRLALYLFNPALYFNSMITAKINNEESTKIILFALLLFVSFTVLIYIINHFYLNYSRDMKSALLLSTAFPNSGNYGLPIILFAFGELGFEKAIIFTVFQSFIMNSFGVYFASNSKSNMKESLKAVLKMPAFVFLIIAIVMRNFNLVPPEFLMRPIVLLGQAAIPTLLIVLGIQLSKAKLVLDYPFITRSVVLRLFIYPLIAFLLIPIFFDITSLTAKVLLVLSATPVAVSTTLFAIQFDSQPQLVSTMTLITTVFSIITISLLLYIII